MSIVAYSNVSVAPLDVMWPVTLTDELSDGAGTPVAISTTIATRQTFQRGRAVIVLSGTYDVDGGEPSGMAWRVGSGDWYRLTGQTVGGGAWSGTLAIPDIYAAQGALEVKPVNGLNVTPASVANITVSDLWAAGGQSNMGTATNLQVYTADAFWWAHKATNGAWADQEGDPWIGGAGSFAPHYAEMVQASGIPPATFAAQKADGTGFINGNWNPGNAVYEQFKSRLAAEIVKSGGFRAVGILVGESDSNNGQTQSGFVAAATAMLDDLYGAIPLLAGTRVFFPMIGERSGANAYDPVRLAIRQLAEEDPRVVRGPHLLNFDFGDGAHYGTEGGGFDTAAANAQLAVIGAAYWRSVFAAATNTPPQVVDIAVGTGAQADIVTVTLDRAMENHADVAGWTISDGIGAVSVTSGAQGETAAVVVLTCARALYGPVIWSFGSGEAAKGGAFREAEGVAGVRYCPDVYIGEAAGTGVGAAPVNTVAPMLSGSTNVGGTATAVDGTYSGVPTPEIGDYQWQVSDAGETGWADIDGATSAGYTIQAGDHGKYLRRGEQATNAVGSSGRVYTAASAQITAETLIASWATDGTATGLSLGNSSTTGVSATTGSADHDGGNDAVTITVSSAGTTGASSVTTSVITFHDGVNHLRMRFRGESGTSWLRIGVLNLSEVMVATTYVWINAATGAKGASTGANVQSATVTAEGDDWYVLNVWWDLSGMTSDFLGNIQINFVESDGGSPGGRNGTDAYRLHDMTLGY